MFKVLSLAAVLASGNCLANETFNELSREMTRLNHTLLKTEELLSGSASLEDKAGLEKLKLSLIEIKRNFNGFNESDGLEKAFKLASAKNWSNTTAFLNKVQSACSSAEGMENGCFVELSEFESFVISRGISESDKEELKTYANSYSKHIEAKIVLNEAFISKVNDLLAKYSPLMVERPKPLATVSLAPAATMKREVISSVVSLAESKHDGFLKQVADNMLVIMGGGLFLMALLLFRSSSRKEKQIKDFYASIFIEAKKNRLKARIFGKVKKTHHAKILKVKRPYIKLISSSAILNTNMDVKFKNRDNKIVIDTVFHLQKPMQELLTLEKYAAFKKEVEEVEKTLSNFGGEISITNTFDQEGRLNQTFFTIEV